MRRLPVYFLLDISDSMIGEPIAEVQKGLESCMLALRSDPYALETVFAGVLAFAGKAKYLTPLTEICDFESPSLPIGSGTNLGAGLNLLMDCIDKEVRKTTSSQKGDWKPLIFLFTDGAPTDDPSQAIKRWNSEYRNGASIIAVTFGDNADVEILEQISDNVLTLKETTPDSFREFFRWVSASLQVSSQAINEGGKEGKLARNCINLEKAEQKDKIDERFAILPIKCSSSHALWLAKYAQAGEGWQLIGAYPVDEASYGEFGSDNQSAGKLALGECDKMPACPICGANQGLLKCGHCGKLSCWPKTGSGNCPWCGADYGKIREVDSLDAGRSRG